MKSSCGAVDGGKPCRAPVDAAAQLGLCEAHLAAAYDWVAKDVGITDVLPSPCLACGSRLGVKYPSGWLCAICEWRIGDILDGEERMTRVDIVYYLRFRDRIKIGTSGNPRGRFAQLRFDELLAFERGGRETEQKRHAQFAAHRFPGSEWFASHEALTAHIEALSVGVENPWHQYQRWVSEQAALRA